MQQCTINHSSLFLKKDTPDAYIIPSTIHYSTVVWWHQSTYPPSTFNHSASSYSNSNLSISLKSSSNNSGAKRYASISGRISRGDVAI